MKCKSSIGIVVFVVMLLSSVLFVSAADSYNTGTYFVDDKDGVRLFDTYESSLDYKTIVPEDCYLTIIKVTGNFGYTVYNSIYGWVDLSDGVSFVNQMPSVTDKDKIEGAKGLKITALPEKLTYVEGEESAEIDGLEVSLVFDDEQESLMPVSGYKVVFPDLETYGEKEVKIYYGGFYTSYPISVKKVPVTAIVIKKPDKTTYVENEAVSLDGLSVTAYFSDGRDEGKGFILEPSEYTITGITDGDSSLDPGTYTVTVTYKYPEITASFHIYVTEKSVVSLKILKMPPLSLYQGQHFNPDDFELSATYDNGITENITGFDIEYENTQIGTYTARIYYMDKYVAFDYTVYELVQTGMEIDDTEFVGSYAGSVLNFSKLKVYAVYNSGEKKLTDNYELRHNIDTSKIGKYPVTVVCEGFSAEFEYTVAKREEIRIGDVNFDGTVNASDARLALRASAELETLSFEAFLAADVNLDGAVGAIDARKILRVTAELEKF